MNLRASADRFDVEQDRAGAAVGGEIVEAVAEIDVDHVAERHEPREADPALRRPFEKPAATAPDCEISARSPGTGVRAPQSSR